jgi:hypothetical protein
MAKSQHEFYIAIVTIQQVNCLATENSNLEMDVGLRGCYLAMETNQQEYHLATVTSWQKYHRAMITSWQENFSSMDTSLKDWQGYYLAMVKS